jgi:hypothetical protein
MRGACKVYDGSAVGGEQVPTWLIIIGTIVIAYIIYRAARKEVGDDLVRISGWAVFLIVVVVIVGATATVVSLGNSKSPAKTSRYVSTSTTQAGPSKHVRIISDSVEVRHNSLGDLILTGKVKNSGTRALRSVKIRGYAYTESGAIVNTDYSYIDSDILAPKATATFSVYVADRDNEAKKGQVEIESARFVD